ncbi:hypothetical protein SRHO_G00070290 [Serrasalmus rhombeus]
MTLLCPLLALLGFHSINAEVLVIRVQLIASKRLHSFTRCCCAGLFVLVCAFAASQSQHEGVEISVVEIRRAVHSIRLLTAIRSTRDQPFPDSQ